MNIPNEVQDILNKLNINGFEAYVVGGCVRDSLLKKIPSDWDICTNALTDDICNIFSEYKKILTGKKFGTVAVIINDKKYEITTFRIDGPYKDKRHPSKVHFSNSLKEDLKRRDFTINAIAYNEKYFDFFDGIKAIENKIIKTVGNPDDRFKEDPLRILRALRFRSVLSFEIEDEVKQSINKNFKLLQSISKERIFEELEKLFQGEKCDKVLNEYFEIFNTIFYLNYGIYQEKKWTDLCTNIKLCKNDIILIYTLLLSYIENMTYCDEIIQKIYINKKDKKKIKDILFILQSNIKLDKISIKKLLSAYDIDTVKQFLKANEIINKVGSDFYINVINKIVDCKECYSLKQLNFNGNDLKKFNFNKKDYSKILKKILDMIIEEKIQNSKDEIFDFLLTITSNSLLK